MNLLTARHIVRILPPIKAKDPLTLFTIAEASVKCFALSRFNI